MLCTFNPLIALYCILIFPLHHSSLCSLQELLLSPSARIEEYVRLLQALSLHTPPEHKDHGHLKSALNTLFSYRSFLQKVHPLHNLFNVLFCAVFWYYIFSQLYISLKLERSS